MDTIWGTSVHIIRKGHALICSSEYIQKGYKDFSSRSRCIIQKGALIFRKKNIDNTCVSVN